MSKRRGRPPSPPEASRNKRVVTFVTAKEFEQINDLAQAEDKPLSLTVYSMLHEHLAGQSGPAK